MAPGLISAAADDLLDQLGTTHSWVQLHTASPGPAGTTAVAQEADRVQATWAPASGANLTSDSPTQWTNVAGNEDYTHHSVWSDAVGGTCGFTGVVSANAVTAGDTFTIPAGDINTSFVPAS